MATGPCTGCEYEPDWQWVKPSVFSFKVGKRLRGKCQWPPPILPASYNGPELYEYPGTEKPCPVWIRKSNKLIQRDAEKRAG